MGVTDNHILATKVKLFDHWNGAAQELTHLPTGGFTGSDHHNIVSPTGGYRVGQKVQYYDKTAKGYVTFVYVQFGTASGVAYAAGAILATAASGDNSSLYDWRVNNDPDATRLYDGRGCIALSAVTAEYYGWAWCGGPCPQDSRAGCSSLAAAYIDCYWDVAVTTGACLASIGNQSLDELSLITPATDPCLIFAELNGVATAK